MTLLKFLCKFSACQKLEPVGRIGDFGNFLNGFALSQFHILSSTLSSGLSWRFKNHIYLDRHKTLHIEMEAFDCKAVVNT